MLQSISRRFLRELDQAPEVIYIIYITVSSHSYFWYQGPNNKSMLGGNGVCLEQWDKTKYYIVIFDQLQGHSGGLIWAPELRVRGPLTNIGCFHGLCLYNSQLHTSCCTQIKTISTRLCIDICSGYQYIVSSIYHF